MKTSESIVKISAAILKAQKAMLVAKKDTNNPFFRSKYADLNAIREAVMPALNESGITVLQVVNGDLLETMLLHESGEYIGSEIKIVTKAENDPQAYGSALTYARRYGLQAIMCVGADDDDAEGAMQRPPETQRKPVNKSPKKVEQDF